MNYSGRSFWNVPLPECPSGGGLSAAQEKPDFFSYETKVFSPLVFPGFSPDCEKCVRVGSQKTSSQKVVEVVLDAISASFFEYKRHW